MRETDRIRVLLLSPHRRVLLIKYRNIGPSGVPRPCWTLAGGRCEDGETVEQTALREISEETGMTDIQLGPVVWHGEDSQRCGDWKFLYKEHFIVGFTQTEAIDDSGWTEYERKEIIETRWRDIEELRNSEETIYPFGLAGLLEPVLGGEYPDDIVTLAPI